MSLSLPFFIVFLFFGKGGKLLANNNDLNIQLVAGLNIGKSIGQLNSEIKALSNEKIKLTYHR